MERMNLRRTSILPLWQKYNTQLDDAEIAAKVAKLIAEKVPGNHTEEVKSSCFTALISPH